MPGTEAGTAVETEASRVHGRPRRSPRAAEDGGSDQPFCRLPAARSLLGLSARSFFNEAHASISVPSTVKCSVDSSFFTRG